MSTHKEDAVTRMRKVHYPDFASDLLELVRNSKYHGSFMVMEPFNVANSVITFRVRPVFDVSPGIHIRVRFNPHLTAPELELCGADGHSGLRNRRTSWIPSDVFNEMCVRLENMPLSQESDAYFRPLV